jgi:hypothetical protein
MTGSLTGKSDWPVLNAALQIAAVQARIEHDQISELADAEATVDLVIEARPRTDRHVFVVRAYRLPPPHFPFTFAGFRIVILGAVAIRVVRRFVIVPDANEGMLPMRFLQIRIGLVKRVAQAIVRERDDLVNWNDVANSGERRIREAAELSERGGMIRAGQGTMQQQPRLLPIALHRPFGDPPHGRDVREREATEVLEIDDLRQAWLQRGELLDRIAEPLQAIAVGRLLG